ncbi:MAG: hypothetical protein HYV07_13340 [Deltaproteobacteria bacterium]|nr:hypothetical protein [Deltaproteobacteria bacterium]
MKNELIALIASLTFLASACAKHETSTRDSAKTSSNTTAVTKTHAPAKAAPRSHEDWCDEHAVPESLCTRCNPSLVPAFRATGDWCEEHGLPESQCKLCNPGLVIARPPPAGGK